MERTGRLLPEAFWERNAQMEVRIRATATLLPCYGLTGWSGLGMVGDWEWENDHLVTVGLAHGAPDGTDPMLHVHTTVRDPSADVASLRMAAAGPPRDETDTLRRRQAFDAGDDESAMIEVGAAGVRFAVWRDGDRWWAAGHHGEHGLVLEARRIPTSDVGLERVYDLDPYIDGRRAYLRNRRGEA